MNPIKEPMFFATADLRLRGNYVHPVARDCKALQEYLKGPQVGPAQYWITEWDDYVQLFRNVHEQSAIGEASVTYFLMPTAAQAIRSKLPGVRLIFMLRDPAERLFSWYLLARMQNPWISFRAWFLDEMKGNRNHGRSVDAGRYATHLQRFFTIFPRHQVRVYLYEALRSDARDVLRDMFTFLDVDPDWPIDLSIRHNETLMPRFPALHRLRLRTLGNVSLTSSLPRPAARALRRLYHRTRGASAINPDDRRMVIDYYRDEILRTTDLIGKDLSAWLR